MKNLVLIVSVIILSSCASSSDVVQKGIFQKRKYKKGYSLAFKKNSESPSATIEKEKSKGGERKAENTLVLNVEQNDKAATQTASLKGKVENEKIEGQTIVASENLELESVVVKTKLEEAKEIQQKNIELQKVDDGLEHEKQQAKRMKRWNLFKVSSIVVFGISFLVWYLTSIVLPSSAFLVMSYVTIFCFVLSFLLWCLAIEGLLNYTKHRRVSVSESEDELKIAKLYSKIRKRMWIVYGSFILVNLMVVFLFTFAGAEAFLLGFLGLGAFFYTFFASMIDSFVLLKKIKKTDKIGKKYREVKE